MVTPPALCPGARLALRCPGPRPAGSIPDPSPSGEGVATLRSTSRGRQAAIDSAGRKGAHDGRPSSSPRRTCAPVSRETAIVVIMSLSTFEIIQLIADAVILVALFARPWRRP